MVNFLNFNTRTWVYKNSSCGASELLYVGFAAGNTHFDPSTATKDGNDYVDGNGNRLRYEKNLIDNSGYCYDITYLEPIDVRIEFPS